VPSVLFETGYITNEADRVLLASPDGRARVAQAVARAVERHLAASLRT
jgi:N-acetylmuramoyl-L-alanine amidase